MVSVFERVKQKLNGLIHITGSASKVWPAPSLQYPDSRCYTGSVKHVKNWKLEMTQFVTVKAIRILLSMSFKH